MEISLSGEELYLIMYLGLSSVNVKVSPSCTYEQVCSFSTGGFCSLLHAASTSKRESRMKNQVKRLLLTILINLFQFFMLHDNINSFCQAGPYRKAVITALFHHTGIQACHTAGIIRQQASLNPIRMISYNLQIYKNVQMVLLASLQQSPV